MGQLRNRCFELYRCPSGIGWLRLARVRYPHGCLPIDLQSLSMLGDMPVVGTFVITPSDKVAIKSSLLLKKFIKQILVKVSR